MQKVQEGDKMTAKQPTGNGFPHCKLETYADSLLFCSIEGIRSEAELCFPQQSDDQVLTKDENS